MKAAALRARLRRLMFQRAPPPPSKPEMRVVAKGQAALDLIKNTTSKAISPAFPRSGARTCAWSLNGTAR